MAGAPKGNKNALKHGLWARRQEVLIPDGTDVLAVRDPSFAIAYLESAIDRIWEKMKRARGEEFARLANALSFASTALFNGHRTIAFLRGGISPVEEAMRELESLRFEED